MQRCDPLDFQVAFFILRNQPSPSDFPTGIVLDVAEWAMDASGGKISE